MRATPALSHPIFDRPAFLVWTKRPPRLHGDLNPCPIRKRKERLWYRSDIPYLKSGLCQDAGNVVLRHQLLAFSISPYSKLTDPDPLYFMHFFRGHSVHTLHAVVRPRIRVKHCQSWTNAMYTRRVYATATRAGVSCLIKQVRSTFLISFRGF